MSSPMTTDQNLCEAPGCKNWAKADGRCFTHRLTEKKFEKGSDDDGKTIVVPKKVIKSTKDAYYGGGANEPHVHVYPGGAHLKLGKNRYNIAQDGAKRLSRAEVLAALEGHGLKDTLAPWVEAAFDYFF